MIMVDTIDCGPYIVYNLQFRSSSTSRELPEKRKILIYPWHFQYIISCVVMLVKVADGIEVDNKTEG
jgi:hypothetical protein